jgi:hypothetical protein
MVVILMIHPTRILLMAAFSLLSALTYSADAQTVAAQVAKAPNIKISALPFNITALGTYVLTGNLTFSVSSPPAAINLPTYK